MRVRIPIVSALASVALLAGASIASAEEPAAQGAKPAPELQNAAKFKAMRDKMAANKPAPAASAEANKAEAKDDGKGKLSEKIDKLEDKKDKIDSKIDKLEDAKTKVAKKMIADKMEEHRKDRADRRREHRKALMAKWGQSVNVPAVREEFRLHARRMAMLHRAKELAEAMENKKALDRITKLTTLEEGRHDRKLAELVKNAPGSQQGAAAAAGSAAPGTVPAAATKEAK